MGSFWAFLSSSNFDLTERELDEVTKMCAENKVLMAINLKYNLPEEKLVSRAKENKVRFIYGLDAHSVKDLKLLRKQFYEKET